MAARCFWNFTVAEDYRRRGIGGKLLAAAEQDVRTHGGTHMQLVWRYRDTPVWVLDWYKRMGYREAERCPEFHKILIKKL